MGGRVQVMNKGADDHDVRMAAAELGVTPQLLATVLSRRALYLGRNPASLRRLEPRRDVLEIAVSALRRRAKVHALDEGVQTGLNTLAQFLEQEALG